MIAHWMLYAVAVALLLGVAALGAERVARLYELPGRWTWVLSTAGSLVLPALALLGGQAVPAAGSSGTVGLLLGPAPPASLAAPGGGSALLAMLHAAVADAVAILGMVRTTAAHLDTALSPLNPVLAVVWALLSAGFVASLVRSAWSLRRVLKRSRPECVDGHDVLISTGIGPAVVGLWRQHIVVPAWVLEEADDARRMILAHEREHMAAGDPRLLAFSFAALALMPWNPALWWQTRRLRLALELDCDARVLRDAADRHGYGTLLLDVVERGGGGTFAAAFAEPRSLLERRIRALSATPPRVRAWRAVAALAGAGLLVAAACAAPHPDGTISPSVTGPGARVAAEGARRTPFSFVVTSTGTGITAVCSRGCSWKNLTATYPRGEYRITDSGVGPLRTAEQSPSVGRFSIALTSTDGHVSATCAQGCLWKTVSGTAPTRRYRITETGITPLR